MRLISRCLPIPRAGRAARSSSGLAGVVFCVIAAIFGMKDFLRGYLIAYMFCLGLTLGCMALLMVQYLTGGFAALSVRRVLEAATKNLPLMFILFIPIAVLRLDLYAWMSNPSLTHENAWYLTQTKWFIRWIALFRDLDVRWASRFASAATRRISPAADCHASRV